MTTTNPSLSVHVKLTIDPNEIEKFLKALRPTFEAVTAEPLNTFFEVYRDDKTPGVFKLVENWNATVDHMVNVSINFHSHSRTKYRTRVYWRNRHASGLDVLLTS